MTQLPTCKRRSSISKSQDVWFHQLHGYSVITPQDIHPSPLQSGNLVPKDLLNITSTWKLTTEGFTHPHLCLHCGVFTFFFFFLNGHPSQSTATLHRIPGYSTGSTTIWQPASGGLSVFSGSASKYHTKIKTRRKKKPSWQDLIAKCQVFTKTKTQAHFQTPTHTHVHTF